MMCAMEKDAPDAPQILRYAVPGPAAPPRVAHYATASLVMAAASAAWWPLNVWPLMNYAKHDRIGMVAAILAISLALAACRSTP